jgi:acyl-CoA thioester hydrolase
MTSPFRYYLRVRYQDGDAQRVVFNSRYSEYADIASVEFMRAALPRPTDWSDGTFEIQTVRQVIEWKSPARIDDILEISAWVSRIGTRDAPRRRGCHARHHRDHLRQRRP